MRQTVRGWRLPRQTAITLDEIARQCNATIRGWWNYYGAFHRSAMHALGWHLDRTLVRWAQRKHKTLRRHKTRAWEWLSKMKKVQPRLFEYWQYGGVKVG